METVLASLRSGVLVDCILYVAGARVDWLIVNTNTSNQFACYLRETVGIVDQCKFLCAGATVVSIQLMTIIINQHVT